MRNNSKVQLGWFWKVIRPGDIWCSYREGQSGQCLRNDIPGERLQIREKVFPDTGRILGRFITPPRPRKDIKCQVSKKNTKSLKKRGVCWLSKREACLISG